MENDEIELRGKGRPKAPQPTLKMAANGTQTFDVEPNNVYRFILCDISNLGFTYDTTTLMQVMNDIKVPL